MGNSFDGPLCAGTQHSSDRSRDGIQLRGKIIQNPKAESVGKWLRAILGAVIFLVGLLLVFGEK